MRYAYTARNFVIANDSVEFLAAAQALQHDGLAAMRSSVRQPLYPAVLWVAGRAAQALDSNFSWRGAPMAETGRLAGMALHPLLLLAAYFFFRRLAGSRLAPWCLLAFIVHPLYGPYLAGVTSETLYLAFFALALLCLVNAFGPSGTEAACASWGIGAGLLTALAYLTREEGQIIVIAGVAFGSLALLRRHGAARRLLAPVAGMLAGFLAVAVPFMVFVGATSARYGWEWVFDALFDGRTALAVPASPDGLMLAALAASPPSAAWMLVRELLTRAPLVTGLFIAALIVARRKSGSTRSLLPDGYRIVLAVMSLNAAAIVVGASLQNGTVSLRYIQPLVLAALPAAALFVDRAISRLHGNPGRVRAAAFTIAIVAALAALAGALARSDDNKIGLRNSGVAIRSLGGDASCVLTTCPRISYYAAAKTGVISTDRLLDELARGRAPAYDFAAIETKRFADTEFDAVRAALAGAGFLTGPGYAFPESPSEGAGGRKILVYWRGGTR